MFDHDDYELHEAQKHACRMAKERDEALLRQALEALLGQRGEPDWHTGKQRENAIAALSAALAERRLGFDPDAPSAVYAGADPLVISSCPVS